MGSNKTSLLLVMTTLMLRKSVKLEVISMRSCVASLLWQVLGSGKFPLRILPNVFLVCREEKPRFEMSTENKWYADLWIIKLLSPTLTSTG